MASTLFGNRRFGFDEQAPPGLDINGNPTSSGMDIDKDYPPRLPFEPPSIDDPEAPPNLDINGNPVVKPAPGPSTTVDWSKYPKIGPVSPEQVARGEQKQAEYEKKYGKTEPSHPFQDPVQKKLDWLNTGWSAPERRIFNPVADMIDEKLDREYLYPTGEGGISDIAKRALQEVGGYTSETTRGTGRATTMFTSPSNIASVAMGAGGFGAARMGLTGIANAMLLGSKAAAFPGMMESAGITADPNRSLPERALGAIGTILPFADIGQKWYGKPPSRPTTIVDQGYPSDRLLSSGPATPPPLPLTLEKGPSSETFQLPPGSPEFSRQVLEKTPSTGEFDLPLTPPARPGGMAPSTTQWAPATETAPEFPIMTGRETPEQRAFIEERILGQMTPDMTGTPLTVENVPQRRTEDIARENPFAEFERQRQSMPRETDIAEMAVPPEDVPPEPTEADYYVEGESAITPRVDTGPNEYFDKAKPINLPPSDPNFGLQVQRDIPLETEPYGPRAQATLDWRKNVGGEPSLGRENTPEGRRDWDDASRSLDWEKEHGDIGLTPEEVGSIVRDVTRKNIDVMGTTLNEPIPWRREKSITPREGAMTIFSQHPDTAQANLAPEDLTGEPSLELIDDEGIQNNASGESGASIEAMNRLKQMEAQGKKFVVYDRAGNARPMIGADAVDYAAKRGETFGIQGPEGFQILDDKGGIYPKKLERQEELPPAREWKPTSFAEQVSPSENIFEPPSEMGIKDWVKNQWERSRSKEHPMIPHEEWQEGARAQREQFADTTGEMIRDITGTKNEIVQSIRDNEPPSKMGGGTGGGIVGHQTISDLVSEATKGPTRIRPNPIGMELGNREDMIRMQVNQYADTGLATATKELVQNFIDATRYLPGTGGPGQAGISNPNAEGNVFLDYHSRDPRGRYSVTVTDNGPGLTLDQIENEYITLTGSGKRGQGIFSGEMGVGKTTYLLGTDGFKISTIVRENDGRVMNYEFEGNKEDMIKRTVQVKETEMDPSTPTGTTVTTYGDKLNEMEATERYLRNYEQYSKSPVTTNIRSNKNRTDPNSVDNLNTRVSPSVAQPGKFVAKKSIKGTDYVITVPPEAHWGQFQEIAVILNSRGQFQGVDKISLGKMGQLPDRIVVDFEPTVVATDKDYPLTAPTRDKMKLDARTSVTIDVINEIGAKALAKRSAEIKKVYDDVTPAPGNRHVIHDAGNRYTPQELHKLTHSPRMKRLADAMEEMLDELDKIFGPNFVPPRSAIWTPTKDLSPAKQLGKRTKFGFLINDPNKGGINISNPSAPRNAKEYLIMMNPFGAIMNSPNAQIAADRMMHIIAHEFNHNIVRSEGGDFTWQFSETLSRLPLEVQAYYADEIRQALTGPNGDYAPELQELLYDYLGARKRPDSQLDLLSDARDSEFIGSGGAGFYELGDGPTGGGISRAEGPKSPGDIKRETGSKEILGEEVGVSQPTKTQAKLQQDLQGAQPRFNIAGDSYIPKFESDVDKALFIIAQKTASKRDKDYLDFVMKQTGMNEVQARMAGQEIRRMIKNIVSGKPAGDIDIPTLNTKINRTELFTGGSGGAKPPSGGKGVTSPEPPNRPPPFNRSTAIEKVGRDIFSYRAPTGRPGGGGGGGTPPPPRTPPPPDSFGGGAPIPPDGGMVVDVNTGELKPKTNNFQEAWNLGRGLKASYDLSAPLRQGILLIHKPEFWKSLIPMAKAGWSEQTFQAIQNEIKGRELYRRRPLPGGKEAPSFGEQAGLKLTDLYGVKTREEAIPSTWAETGGNIPYFSAAYRATIGRGVRASNRAYTAFLNKLRADTFESLMHSAKVFGVNGEANMPVARAMADFVNNATGRGDLGKLEQSAHILNMGVFSPRLIKARLHFMNPQHYIMGPKAVRMEYLKSLFAIAAFGGTILQLGRMAGFKVGTDPNSADFGKLIIGNIRLDPWGGFQQYIVAANRLIRPSWMGVPGLEHVETGVVPIDVAAGYAAGGGQRFTSTVAKPGQKPKEYDLWNPKPGPYDPTQKDILERFAVGKSHPVVNFAWGLANRRTELSGRKMNFTTTNPLENTVMQQFLPILWTDLYEAGKEDPRIVPLVGVPSFFGMGAQAYSEKGVGRGK